MHPIETKTEEKGIECQMRHLKMEDEERPDGKR